MAFALDLAKNEANRSKPGVSYEEAQKLWDMPGVDPCMGSIVMHISVRCVA